MHIRINHDDIVKLIATHFRLPEEIFRWDLIDEKGSEGDNTVTDVGLILEGGNALRFLSAAEKIGYVIVEPSPGATETVRPVKRRPASAKRPRRARSPR